MWPLLAASRSNDSDSVSHHLHYQHWPLKQQWAHPPGLIHYHTHMDCITTSLPYIQSAALSLICVIRRAKLLLLSEIVTSRMTSDCWIASDTALPVFLTSPVYLTQISDYPWVFVFVPVDPCLPDFDIVYPVGFSLLCLINALNDFYLAFASNLYLPFWKYTDTVSLQK